MKKTLLLFASCTAVFLMAGCTKETGTDDSAPKKENTGTFVTFTSSPITRTSTSIVGNESKTVWVEGDEITISYDGNEYIYVAQEGGETTSFLPKTDADAIPVAEDHTYTLTAVYGNGLTDFTSQTVTGGVNTFQQPLSASLEAYVAEDDKPILTFSQDASLVEFTFAAEPLTISSLRIEGLQTDVIDVSFTDGLDLSSGASVQVVCGAISTDSQKGVYLNATLSDDTHIGRVIWLGDAKSFDVGSHVRQALSAWKTGGAGSGGGISTGRQLKEFQILTSKGCPVTRFTADGTPDGKVALLADVDISSFAPWSPIAPNGNADPSVTWMEHSVLNNEFDGGGHTVSGFSLSRQHSGYYNYGLFGVAAADIHDLTVEGSMSITSGSTQNVNLCAGGLVSTLRPGCSVQRCTTNVAINVAYYGTAALSGSDVYNANSATVHKWQRVGGIVGRCSGLISESVNKGSVKFTNGTSAKTVVVNCHYGGIAGQVCEYGSNDAGISDCTNTGNIASQGKISGYGDKPGGTANISTVYQVFQGMSLGGIVGTLGHMVTADMPAQSGTAYLNGCTNNGEIGNNYNGAGGNFGGVAGRTGCDAAIRITNCGNTKSVYGSKSSGESQQSSNNDFFNTMGGVVGACHARGGELSGLTNSGNVYVNNSNTAAVVGGVFGIISAFSSGVDFTDLTNSGGVYTSKDGSNSYLNIGGIVGRVWTQNQSAPIVLNAPVNTGYIRNQTNGQKARVGGLVGYTNGYLTINDGVNKGNTTAWTKSGSSGYGNVSFVGGLIGEVGNNFPTVFNRCKQYGYVSYNNTASCHALIIGCYYQKDLKAVDCYVSGSFGLSGGTTYTISSAEDLASMVNMNGSVAPMSVSEGHINMVGFYDSSCAVGSTWQWSYHDVE